MLNNLTSAFIHWFMTTSDRNVFAVFYLVDFVFAVILTVIVMAVIEFVKAKVSHILWRMAKKRELERQKTSIIRMRKARRRRAAYGYKGYDKNVAA